jgi:hypothetical protein
MWEVYTEFWQESLKEGARFGDLGVDGMTILKGMEK